MSMMRSQQNILAGILVCLALFWSVCHADAVSVRVLQGGIPVGDLQQLVEEGFRLGNERMLRQAWDAYEKAVHLDPDAIDGYRQLGRVYFNLSLIGATGDADFARASEYARLLEVKEPGSADAHHIMGLVLSGKGAFLDALDELRLALSLKPANELILCDIASIHLALHQPDETIRMLEGKALKRGWSYYILAMAWLQKGERGRAWLNLLKARKQGFSGYWVDTTLEMLMRDIRLERETAQ